MSAEQNVATSASSDAAPKRIVYRVRTKITGDDIIPKEYFEWLKTHINKLMKIRNAADEPVFSSVSVRKGREDGKEVYVADHETTDKNLAEYKAGLNAPIAADFRENWGGKVSSLEFTRQELDRSNTTDAAEILKVETDRSLTSCYSNAYGASR